MSLPHVTEILRDAGLVDTTWFTEEARDRGSAVHLAARFLDEGDLDRDSLDPSVAPRLAQYERFLLDVRPEILAIEEAVRNEALGYCGTLDRRIRLNGFETILDIKGPSEAHWHGTQLALYAMCFERPLRRFNLYLYDESYRLVPRADRADYAVGKAAITIANFRRAHGLALDPARV